MLLNVEFFLSYTLAGCSSKHEVLIFLSFICTNIFWVFSILHVICFQIIMTCWKNLTLIFFDLNDWMILVPNSSSRWPGLTKDTIFTLSPNISCSDLWHVTSEVRVHDLLKGLPRISGIGIPQYMIRGGWWCLGPGHVGNVLEDLICNFYKYYCFSTITDGTMKTTGMCGSLAGLQWAV